MRVCAGFLLVKLTDEPSNFLTTTDSSLLESLSLYMLSKRLFKTLNLSHHLLLQYNSGMSLDDGKCLFRFLSQFCVNMSRSSDMFPQVFQTRRSTVVVFLKENRYGFLKQTFPLIYNHVLERLRLQSMGSRHRQKYKPCRQLRINRNG